MVCKGRSDEGRDGGGGGIKGPTRAGAESGAGKIHGFIAATHGS